MPPKNRRPKKTAASSDQHPPSEMATNSVHHQPTAAADQPSESRSSLGLNALNYYWPNWRDKGSVILPPIYEWKNPAFGQSALDDQARMATALKDIPGRSKDFDRTNKFATDDESSRGEHVVHRALHELFNDKVIVDELGPMFGFGNLILSNENDAIEMDVWNRVLAGIDKKTLGELDFTILGSKIGLICIEVKSSPYPHDFLATGSKRPKFSRLEKDIRKFDKSTILLRGLLEESTGIRIDDASLPMRRVLLFTNVERPQFNAWYARLDDGEEAKTLLDSPQFLIWCKDDLEADESKRSSLPELRKLLIEMAGEVEKLESSKKESLKDIYEAFVPIMVGMKSLILGKSKETKGQLSLNKEQVSILEAIVAEERKLNCTDWTKPAAPKLEKDDGAVLPSVRRQQFLTPSQQAILHDGGRRKLIFGRAGVGKTSLLWEKIRRQILEERQNAKSIEEGGKGRKQLPVMIITPESISGEYHKFLRDDCKFEEGIDYQIDDRYFFEIYFEDSLEKVLPLLFELAKRTGNYRAMLAWILMYFAEKPGREGHVGEPDNAIMLKEILGYMMDKQIVEKLWSRLDPEFKTVINSIDHNTLREFISADRLVAFLRSKGIVKMALNIFETPDELIEFLRSIGAPNTIIDYVPMVFAMKSFVDPLTIVEPILRPAYQSFLDSTPGKELTDRLRQLDDVSSTSSPIFTTMTDEIPDGASDQEVLMRFIKDAMNNESIREQIKSVLPWLSENSHVFIDDTLDQDKTSLRYPYSFLVGVALFMELIESVNRRMNVWVAIDPYKCSFADYPNSEQLFDKIVANLDRLQTSDEPLADGSKQRFDVCTLRDVMRCSTQIFERCYESEKATMSANGWRELIDPRPGHKYSGATPIVGPVETFPTFVKAVDGLWSKVKEAITFLETQGLVETQFALIVGDRGLKYDSENTLFERLKSKCSNDFDRCIQKFHRSIYHWIDVSSLEWPVVIYVNVLPKGIDFGESGVYRKYRAMSRAMVHLIEFEYVYEKEEESSIGEDAGCSSNEGRKKMMDEFDLD